MSEPIVPAVPADLAQDAAGRVWRQLREQVLHWHARRREACDAVGLSFSRVRALVKLQPAPMTMRDLATALGIDRPYATLVIDELEGRGLVARTVHPEDRRHRLVGLTPAGQETAGLADRILNTPPPVLATLPPADLAALERVTALLAAAPPSGTGEPTGR
jgi:DNA-binding MarR family transcriptional regulator